jgi:enamine deaminase RidA (YjgF/YER057c/UK114 family)
MKQHRTFELIRRFGLTFIVVLVFANFGCKNNNTPKTLESKSNDNLAVVKEKWHWDSPDKQNENAGYAQVVKVGGTIYISGVPTSDLSTEGVTRLYKTLEQCLSAYGATAKDVVKETLYTTDIEEMKRLNIVRKKFYQGDYPAASWVQIDRLYESNAKLEVDLIAELTVPNQ